MFLSNIARRKLKQITQQCHLSWLRSTAHAVAWPWVAAQTNTLMKTISHQPNKTEWFHLFSGAHGDLLSLALAWTKRGKSTVPMLCIKLMA
jgi:hypothetical protein